MRWFLRLFPYVRQLENELERERIRLAVCGVAALGYFERCKPEYESASLHDVLRLRRGVDERAELDQDLRYLNHTEHR